jgi:hypothetical protein
MKGKFGIAALIFVGGVALASPVSSPNPVSDTPIISGGFSSGSICKAYHADRTAVPLSGGETLVFYGGGSASSSAGGYLSTKTTYSGIAYLRTSGRGGGCYCVRYYYSSCQEWYCLSGSGIGLFTSPIDTSYYSFIAGAGAGFGNRHGGGWYGDGGNGNIYSGIWFAERMSSRPVYYCYDRCGIRFPSGRICQIECATISYILASIGGVGFHGGSSGGGGASSISAFYSTPLRNYTTPGNTLTVMGGGHWGAGNPTLYVCQ